MRLPVTPGDIASLQLAISEAMAADYVYSYPPRQAYRTLKSSEAVVAAQSAVSPEEALNLYAHVPFCEQICKFCNLFAVADNRYEQHQQYLEALVAQIEAEGDRCAKGQPVNSIYVGGGTPSLLEPSQLDSVLDAFERVFSIRRTAISEVALEVAPSTVDGGRLSELSAVGFNRVNLGVQSVADSEVLTIGRRYASGVQVDAIEKAMAVGFDNVCVDLIYGLPGQTQETFSRSLRTVMEISPETICIYPLTVRDGTSFGRTEEGFDGQARHRMFVDARELLEQNGYAMETHVRFIKEGTKGGYIQKTNHWRGEALLGFGAGARTYTEGLDWSAPYSLSPRRAAIDSYYEQVRSLSPAVEGGIVMTHEERMRKSVILGLFGLSRGDFRLRHGVDPLDQFSEEFDFLTSENFVECSPEMLRLTRRGAAYRDLIVGLFFSDEVRDRCLDYSYR